MHIQDSTSGFRELHLALALESVCSAALAGAGDTGDTIGAVTELCSITTAMSPTAEFSPIAASITPADFMAVSFTAEEHTDSHRMPRPALTPGHLAVSIMAVCQEAFPHAGSRASEEVSMAEAEASTEAEAVTANSFQPHELNR
jgi:hypothetical protein